ncbi:MAG: peptidoglycan-binding protein [Candidatus Binatia bacterium]
MKARREILTAALLSASVGLGAQSLFAQSTPGSGSSMPGSQDRSGPTVPQPGPATPQRPTIPGQPAPGLPQTDPVPGQPGTIPERVERPDAGQQNMAVTSEDIKKAQKALKAKGLNPGADGRMDAKTQQALRDFQKANDLPITGVLDEKTAAKLGVNLGAEGKSTPGHSRGSRPSSKSGGSLR